MSKLIVKDVTFSYDQENIIEDINIELHDNELVCLLGSSGGGKTTLFNVISGLRTPRYHRAAGTYQLYAPEGPASAISND